MQRGSRPVSKTYTFDHVFPPEATQESLFKTVAHPIVNEVLKGFNCTIFAYGQTGTGKTYTMEGLRNEYYDGDSENISLTSDSGIIPRSIDQIFDTLEKSEVEYSVRVSFLEIYNEEIRDLLGATNEPLRILDGLKGTTVQGLEEISVNSSREIFDILDRGLKRRQTAETLMNHFSRYLQPSKFEFSYFITVDPTVFFLY